MWVRSLQSGNEKKLPDLTELKNRPSSVGYAVRTLQDLTKEKSLFDQIKAVLDLRKEIPDAVGYDTYGPIVFPLPLEIRDAIPQSITQQLHNLTLISVRIDNYSSKTQRDIRVLFSGDWAFAPKFSFHRRDVEVKSKILVEDKEIVLLEIPPNESVSIEIFNPSKGFGIDQVLLGDVEITKVMQKLAEAKRYPALARLKLLFYAMVLVSILAVPATVFLVWNRVSEQQKIDAANAGLLSCTPYIFTN